MKKLLLLLLLATPAFAVGTNSITITEKTGVTQTNYPALAGRPFADGEIALCPRPVIDGTPAVTWQADVLQRWPSGDVKHAVVSFIIPTFTANTAYAITFVSTACANTPLTKTEMLDAANDFDATIELTNGATQVVSARAILEAAASCPAYPDHSTGCTRLTSGQVAQTVLLTDHTSAAAYDIGFKDRKYTALSSAINSSVTTIPVYYGSDMTPGDSVTFDNETCTVNTVAATSFTVATSRAASCTGTVTSHAKNVKVTNNSLTTLVGNAPNQSYKSFRPIFFVTFWPTINKVMVRFVGEIANTQTLQDLTYSLALTTGDASPSPVYSKTSFKQSARTRWTKLFWIGTAPTARQINHNFPYLVNNYFISNYDTSLGDISESAISNATTGLYPPWQAANKDIGGAGVWNKFMPDAGQTATSAIGPTQSWILAWLQGGDVRMEEESLGQQDLSASFPIHYREGATGRFFDRADTVDATGKVISVSARPTFYLTNLSSVSAADLLNYVSGPSDAQGWTPDNEHQWDAGLYPYMLTGDPWYLEELQFWAAQSLFYTNAGSLFSNRGPTGEYGAIFTTTIRGDAWVLRNRINAGYISPDAGPEQAYFNQKIGDALAIWEGTRGIACSDCPANQTAYNWGVSTGSLRWGGIGVPPLHNWDRGICCRSFVPSIDTAVTYSIDVPWQEGFLGWSLSHAEEFGYPATALRQHHGANVVGAITDPGYNPYLIGAYESPARRVSDQGYFPTWTAELTGFTSAGVAAAEASFLSTLTSPEPAYAAMATAWAAVNTDITNGQAAWDWISALTFNHSSMTYRRHWLIKPRGATPPIVISSVLAGNVTTTTATITWSTDQATTGNEVDWGTTTGCSSTPATNSDTGTSQSITLTGLTQNTLYYFKVKSTNVTGTSTSGDCTTDNYTFTTAATPSASNLIVFSGNEQTGPPSTQLASPVRAKATDGAGDPVSGVNWTAAIVLGGGSLGTASGTTGGDGLMSTTWTLGSAGSTTNTMTFTVPGATGSPLTLTATSDPVPLQSTAILSGNKQTCTVATACPAPLHAITMTVFNNLLPGVTMTCAVTAGGGSITAAPITRANATYSPVFVMGATPGTNTATCTTPDGNTTITFTMTAVSAPGAATQIRIFGGNKQTALRNTWLQTPLTVEVRDASNKKVGGVVVTFGTDAGTLSSASCTTRASGTCGVNLLLPNSATSVTVTAESGVLTGSPLSFTETSY